MTPTGEPQLVTTTPSSTAPDSTAPDSTAPDSTAPDSTAPSTTVEDQVALLKTIADPTRLRILGLLAAREHSGRELAQELSLSPATISYHLGLLGQVGLVTSRAAGTRRWYGLNHALVAEVGHPRHASAPVPDDQFHRRTVAAFFDGERLLSIPTKRRARASVLMELLRRFEPGRDYTEAEVNQVLRPAHEDVAYLRRELIQYRYLTRDAGVYRVTSEVPRRDATEAQEVPRSEAAWLGALIASVTTGSQP